MKTHLSSKKSLDGNYVESDLPLLIQRRGMAAWEDGIVRILDRRKLPNKVDFIICKSYEDVAFAIESMAIQGAFSISIAAGYGLALSLKNNCSISNLEKASARLISTRPTGIALKKVIAYCQKTAMDAMDNNQCPVSAIIELTSKVASDLAKQAQKTAQNAISLLNDGDTILTHCFPDRSYVYLLVEAKKRDVDLNIICSETRPYFQGTKLSAFCSSSLGFKTKVISDGMGGALMQQGLINAFITAADRVCMDGTVANKIGTYQYALAARENKVPYYVLRQSGPDIGSDDSSAIEIEERDGDELTVIDKKNIAPKNVQGYYPAFDITSSDLVTRIITDRGIFVANEIKSYFDNDSFIDNSLL